MLSLLHCLKAPKRTNLQTSSCVQFRTFLRAVTPFDATQFHHFHDFSSIYLIDNSLERFLFTAFPLRTFRTNPLRSSSPSWLVQPAACLAYSVAVTEIVRIDQWQREPHRSHARAQTEAPYLNSSSPLTAEKEKEQIKGICNIA